LFVTVYRSITHAWIDQNPYLNTNPCVSTGMGDSGPGSLALGMIFPQQLV